ncbi:SET domain-containing protein-lysine N-methyltransferase [Streptosporangium longisporum]|uniref:SET domain-containing protein n=1 Tax=Streptosporangium longisporum TaxID=46187 RepID=A0ABP6KGB2_9ACTN
MSNVHDEQIAAENRYRIKTDCTSGTGLVAGTVIEAGSEVMTLHDCVPSTASKYTIQVNQDLHVIGSDIRFLNHSCRPNTFVDTTAGSVISIRRILPDDEITFFYPSTEWEMSMPFDCRCGWEECVGEIKGAAFLDPETSHRYRLNNHIVMLMTARENGQALAFEGLAAEKAEPLP